ncbi:TRAP transporter large permease [Castellaniella sp.]|uniref:TRAP transporter large permease n=1 Tax=Castellaniella sp. TaxID=1955812 RepID=UPI003566AAD8
MITALLVLIATLLIGVPVAFSIGLASLAYFLAAGANLLVFPQQVIGQLSALSLVAIPFFILAGELMNTGGITMRIFNFALAVVGRVPGALGHANVLGSMLFAGMSGSAVADVASLGRVELKAMRENDYPDDLSVGLTVSSATLGPIIPPSINMVIYGSIAGVPVGLLFMGGVMPGVLSGAALMMTFAYIYRRRRLHTPRVATISIGSAFRSAFWALMTPVVLLGALFSGFATPTESAVIAAIYASIVALFVYKEMSYAQFFRALLSTTILSAAIMVILGLSAPLGYIIARDQVASQVAMTMVSTISDHSWLLLALALLLLIVGIFLEVAPAMIILVPIVSPPLVAAGIDPILLGVFIVYGLGIGLISPGLGMCLFVGSQISGMSLERVMLAVLPFIFPLIVVLLLMIPFPEIVTWIPTLVYGKY